MITAERLWLLEFLTRTQKTLLKGTIYTGAVSVVAWKIQKEGTDEKCRGKKAKG